jgi:hypothetical protein
MTLAPSLYAQNQLTIDATGLHKTPNHTSSGSATGVGRRLPLQITIAIQNTVPREHGRTIVEFILTNSGKDSLDIPVALEAEQVESSNSSSTYKFRCLRLHITKEGEIPANERTLPGGAVLYGSDKSGTLVTLAPGDIIRVLADVALPRHEASGDNGPTLIAWVAIDEVTVTKTNGKASSDSQEVGYATSPSYTLEALFKSLK